MAHLGNTIVNGNLKVLNGIAGNGTLVDLKDNTRSIEYIKGTQTAATGSWTGVTKDTALYDGKTILYFLPYAGSGNASLNLTLAGGTTTGAIEVWATGSTRCTTHYGVNSTILLTYVASLNRWTRADYWDGNTYDRLLDTWNRFHAGIAIYPYEIIMLGADGQAYPLSPTNSTGSSKAVSTTGVYPDMAWYWYSSGTCAAGSRLTALYRTFPFSTPTYCFNAGIPQFNYVFLCGDYNKSTNLFYLATTNGANNSTGTASVTNYYTFVPKGATLSSYFITGRYYKLIGWPCDTANYMTFDGAQPLQYFNGTNLIPVANMTISDAFINALS